MELSLFLRFGVAGAIGILIGLQREYAHRGPDERAFAGVRTFPLIALLGCSAALAADLLDSPWPFVAAMLVLGVFLTVSYYADVSQGRPGLTTEITALLAALAGAFVYWDQIALAVALGVAVTALLSFKLELHGFVRNLTQEDIYAAIKFAVITAIILPVLPNRNFGPAPFDVFNPYEIWLLVVLISGISFVGYVLVKVLDARSGVGLIGLLGGLASSTAVTLSFTQRSQNNPSLARPFAFAIIIAWTVMYGRVLVAVAALNFPLASLIGIPIAASILSGLAYCFYLFYRQRTDNREPVSLSNPFELAPAIKFGLLFVLILLISKAAQVFGGNSALLVSSFLSGLADVDAIALSVAELSRGGSLAIGVAGQAVLLAAIANTLAKGALVLIGGTSGLRRAILPGYLLMMGTSAIAIALLV